MITYTYTYTYTYSIKETQGQLLFLLLRRGCVLLRPLKFLNPKSMIACVPSLQQQAAPRSCPLTQRFSCSNQTQKMAGSTTRFVSKPVHLCNNLGIKSVANKGSALK